MPNGRPGDHPVTDIVVHGFDVFSPRVDALIREIARLHGRQAIYALDEEMFAAETALASLASHLLSLREELDADPSRASGESHEP